MNKELIVKFEKVFLHWVHGGAVLKYSYCPTSIPVDDGTWSKLGDFYNWGAEYIAYVIDDEYVELRKALALGGTIQYFNRDTGVWQDCVNQTEADREFHTPLGDYRVKAAVKSGDWVHTSNGLMKVRCIDQRTIRTVCGSSIANIDGIEVWKPKINEWCWFWTNKKGEWENVPILCRFESLTTDGWYAVKEFGRLWFQDCEPFIGTLPSKI